MRKFVKNNWVEIVAVFGVIVGIVFVFQGYQLMEWFSKIRLYFQDNFGTTISNITTITIDLINRITVIDLAGFLLAVFGILFIGLRTRHRYLNSRYWLATTCPRCGGDLHRVRRNSFDRLLSKTFLPQAHRYLCKNQECRWTGLKHIDHGRRRHPVESDFVSEES